MKLYYCLKHRKTYINAIPFFFHCFQEMLTKNKNKYIYIEKRYHLYNEPNRETKKAVVFLCMVLSLNED